MDKMIISKRLYQIIFKPRDIAVKDEEHWINLKDTVDVIDGNNYDFTLSISTLRAGNYFDVRGGIVTYMPTGTDQEVSATGRWVRDGRLEIKVSKVIKGILGDKPLSPAVLNRFIELVTSDIGSTSLSHDSIKVSDDPSGIYGIDILYSARDVGSLYNSCMRSTGGYGCYEGKHLYNDMGVKVAYVEKDGKLISRALLWDDVHTVGGDIIKLMDRVYGSESYVTLMTEWATDNGYAFKSHQDYGSYEAVMPNGETVDVSHVELQNSIEGHDKYPYMDTFRNTDDWCVLMSEHHGGYYSLTDCDGNSGGVECYACGARIPRDESYNVDGEYACSGCVVEDYRGDYIFQRDAIELHDGRWIHEDGDYVELYDGYYALHDSDVVLLHNGDYALREDATRLHDGEYALNDDVVELHDGEYALERDAIQLHDGEYALKDDVVELHNGEYALDDDVVELHDGEYALDDDVVKLHDGEYALRDDVVKLHDGRYALDSDDVIKLHDGSYALAENLVETLT